MLVDSHCHLDFEDFKEEGVSAVLKRAKEESGVDYCLTICTHISKFKDVHQIALDNDHVYCTVGTHPHQSNDEEELPFTLEQIVNIANANQKVVGIGETGLDYYYDFSPVDVQKENFRKHLRASMETDLPIIVHSRDADQDTIDIMREEGADNGLKGVMHCFSSGPDLAKNALDSDLYISFSGILTFKNADELRDIAKNVPLDRVLVETDSPYLAPIPHRGKRNEPAFVKHTARYLAELHGLSLEEIETITTNNFFRLFDKIPKPENI